MTDAIARTAIVTGGARGIRAAIAARLAADGMAVGVLDVAGDLGPPVVVVNNAGVTRDNLIFRMADSDWDTVMNVHLRGAFLVSRAADFDLVMRIHVRGTWLTTREAARRWRARAAAGERFTGRIINTTSGAGLSGNFGQSNYATAKAAIVGLTLTTSLELYKMGSPSTPSGWAG